jgi:hypothetical protein
MPDVWHFLSTIFSGMTLVVVMSMAYRYGRLEQLVKDINDKGCSMRRNGKCD